MIKLDLHPTPRVLQQLQQRKITAPSGPKA